MGTIIGTLTFEPARNTAHLGFYFYTCTKNIRTINKIHNLRNKRNIVQELGTKINDLEQDLGSRDTVLGKGCVPTGLQLHETIIKMYC